MAVQANSGIGHIFREGEAIVAFAREDIADLAAGVHFIDAAGGVATGVAEDDKHFAFVAVVGTIEPSLGSVGLGAGALAGVDLRSGGLGLQFVGWIEVQNSLAGLADDELFAV